MGIGYLLFFLTVWGWAEATEKLVKAVHISTVGGSNPSSIAGTWFEKPGALTQVGMRQQYLLGRQLRQRYVEDYQLISDQFNQQHVTFRAAYSTRTAASMSAYAFAAGLYMAGTGYSLNDVQISKAVPPVNFTDYTRYQKELDDAALLHYFASLPVKTITVEPNYDLEAATLCPNLKKLAEDYRNGNDSLKRKVEEREQQYKSKLYPALAKAVGKQGDSMDWALECRDYIMAAKHLAHDLPYKLTDEELKLMDELYETKKYLDFFGDIKVARIVSSGLLAELLDFVNTTLPLTKDQFQSVPKNTAMISYTLDDWNLLGFLRLLNYQPKEKSLTIPFASSIQVEVWHVGPGETAKDFNVNVSFNGVPVQWDNQAISLTLPEFRGWLQKNMIKDFQESCVGKPGEEDMTSWSIVSLILGLVILAILGATCYCLMRKSGSGSGTEEAAGAPEAPEASTNINANTITEAKTQAEP